MQRSTLKQMVKRFYRLSTTLLSAFAISLLSITPSFGASRIKDIVDIEGVRDNMLIGYGLVVGLKGTGDSLSSSPFTEQSLIAMLERLGVNTREFDLKTDNVAAVMVTATLPPFTVQGSRIDVNVAALGDADSLQGGTLLVTPLMGADSEIYAIAQGNLAVGGFEATGNAASIQRGVTTNARIANGAIIEREIPFALQNLKTVRLSLRNPDFTTARRISQAINSYIGKTTATVLNPAAVEVSLPPNYQGDVVAMITDIEQLRVVPDQVARVIIDEHSGVIVMGENVRISTVAVAQGNLTVTITETPQVSQPNPFAEQGETVTVDRTNIDVDDDSDKQLAVLNEGVTLKELVSTLNALGVGPRDMITILQSIKAAGAMQAEIEVM